MLIFCSEETLFSAEIGMDDRMEAPSLKYVAGLVGEGFVDFQYQQTVFFQVLLGDVRDGAVEAKWVVVGNEERQGGVVVEDVAMHLLSFAFAHIRRIGNNQVKG